MSNANLLKIGVLASGRGSNLQSILNQINAGKIPAQIVVVASDKADAAALERAKQAGIKAEVLLPSQFSNREAYDAALAELLKRYDVQLVVLAGFMRIIGRDFLNKFPHSVINIHPALLPSFPGLHAQIQTFNYGVKVAGCTVHFVDSGVDTGPIIAQRAVPVLEDDDVDSLTARILEQEHQLYPYVIAKIAQNKVILKERKVIILD